MMPCLQRLTLRQGDYDDSLIYVLGECIGLRSLHLLERSEGAGNLELDDDPFVNGTVRLGAFCVHLNQTWLLKAQPRAFTRH